MLFADAYGDWYTHTATAIGTAAVTIIGSMVGCYFFFRSKLTAQRAADVEQWAKERETELTIRKRENAVCNEEENLEIQSLRRIVQDLNERAAVQSDTISTLYKELDKTHKEHLETMRKTILQEARIEAQNVKIQLLQDEVSRLTVIVNRLSTGQVHDATAVRVEGTLTPVEAKP